MQLKYAHKLGHVFLPSRNEAKWLGGVTVRTLDLLLKGREFDSRSGRALSSDNY